MKLLMLTVCQRNSGLLTVEVYPKIPALLVPDRSLLKQIERTALC